MAGNLNEVELCRAMDSEAEDSDVTVALDIEEPMLADDSNLEAPGEKSPYFLNTQ